MILKASQRGGGAQLGRHLLKAENEQIEVHEIRGFVADTIPGAMKEAQAVAAGTRCKQNLFSVSLNPPEAESVPVEAFEAAIDRIETATGLTGQPRMVVFHEKEGRRHAHAVWSRIDPDTMTAKPLPFFKTKLREVSKELYLEHGWQMPRGLMDSKERDPRNFDLAEWQQAKRMARDPKQLKAAIQECWAVSNSPTAFAKALEDRGLYLARGDRRGHVAVTYEGEALSIGRMVGKKTKEITAKLGQPDELASVADTRARIAEVVAPRLKGLITEAEAAQVTALTPLSTRRAAMRKFHKQERVKIDEQQALRRNEETRVRSARLRKGALGLWDRITGKHARTTKENEAEASSRLHRDRAERHSLVTDQLKDRRNLQKEILAVRQQHTARVQNLYRDLAQQHPRSNERGDSAGRDASRPARTSEAERPTASLRRTARPRGQSRESQGPRGPGLG